MAAIAGVAANSSQLFPELLCKTMLKALEPCSSAEFSIETNGDTSFGRNLDFYLPEDSFDRQPFRAHDGSLFVADARVDNREELIGLLSRPRMATYSDADLLFAAWQRWKLELIGHVLGDYALAAWDGERGELILLRSPLGQKPLFYMIDSRASAFASDPSALHRSKLIQKAPRLDFAARIISLEPNLSSASMYVGIEQVPHAHAVIIRRGSQQLRRLWWPQRTIAPFRNAAEAGEALRAELDRAVKASVRRREGLVASQLSSGRDSAAVSTSAALALQALGQDLVCFTGSPGLGFVAPATRYHIADESDLARRTASHASARHIVVRPEPRSAIADMEELHAVHHMPFLNPANLPWWGALERAAAKIGTRVLLNAEGGNFTLSLGGPELIGDVIAEEGWSRGLFRASSAALADPARAPTVINHLLGPYLPRAPYKILRSLIGRPRLPEPQLNILKPAYRKSGMDEVALFDPRPKRTYIDYRLSLMMKRDFPGKMSEAKWGFERRDPTSDRRLVELCNSIPARYLFGAYRDRPAYAAAFNSRLPAEVRNPSKRGWQGADWADHFTADAVRSAFAKYLDSPPVSELLDPEALARATEDWPNANSASVLAALSVASFLWVHFPG